MVECACTLSSLPCPLSLQYENLQFDRVTGHGRDVTAEAFMSYRENRETDRRTEGRTDG